MADLWSRFLCTLATISSAVQTLPLLPGGSAPPATAWTSRLVDTPSGTVREDSIDLGAAGGAWPRPSKLPKKLRMLRGVLDQDEVNSILELVSSASFLGKESSENPVVTEIEGLASEGVWYEHKPLAVAIKPIVEERLLPYMREELRCPSLQATDVLVRRYSPDTPREYRVHFDHNAMGTAVFDLTPQPGRGLFVSPTVEATSHFYVPFATAGDVAVHSWDVLHGVQLRTNTERIALVVWTKSAEEIEAGTTSFYMEDAMDGDVDAAFRWGLHMGHGDNPDFARAQLTFAAERGHAHAMRILSDLLEKSGERAESKRWMAEAAGTGLAPAQVEYADMLRRDSDFEIARHMYEAAALQGNSEACYRLSMTYMFGIGVEEDSARAFKYLQMAAEMGNQVAAIVLEELPHLKQNDVFRLLAASDEGAADAIHGWAMHVNAGGHAAKALKLLQRAAEVGHPPSIVAIAALAKES